MKTLNIEKLAALSKTDRNRAVEIQKKISKEESNFNRAKDTQKKVLALEHIEQLTKERERILPKI